MDKIMSQTLPILLQQKEADRRWLAHQFVTVRQAASLLSMGTRTIYKLIAAHELPAYRLHRMVRLKLTDIEALMTRIERPWSY